MWPRRVRCPLFVLLPGRLPPFLCRAQLHHPGPSVGSAETITPAEGTAHTPLGLHVFLLH